MGKFRGMLVVLVLVLSLVPAAQAQVCIDGQTEVCGYNNLGECREGTTICHDGEWGNCIGAVYPTIRELCDGLDDDCDGVVDNDCASSDMTWMIMIAGGIILLVLGGLLNTKSGKKKPPKSKWEEYR